MKVLADPRKGVETTPPNTWEVSTVCYFGTWQSNGFSGGPTFTGHAPPFIPLTQPPEYQGYHTK